MQDLLIELLQVSLGTRGCLSRVPNVAEWNAVYDECLKQAIIGVAFAGIQRLPETQWPPKAILLQWFGCAEQVRLRNQVVDKETREIWNRLKDDGLDAVILKGQGIAQLYGELAEYRQSGDIDVWVKGGYQSVCDYVQRTHPTDDVAYHRFNFDFFEDTEVELHHRPTLMRNLIDDKKLAKWYNSFGADSFVYLEDKGVAVPPMEFNCIFILTHIYRHFLFEGIGLRQILDYYYVLKSDDKYDKEAVCNTLKELRLTKFAEASMWVLHAVLGLEENKLICGQNEKEGRFLMSEIEQTRNFGHSDTRYQYRYFVKLRRQIAHGAHLLFHYPSEVLWTPIWLVYHKMWKWNKVRKIKIARRLADSH